MKLPFFLFAVFAFLSPTLLAEDSLNLAGTIAKYQEERTRGLLNLNQKYINAYEAELESLLKAQKLDEANAVKDKIKSLEEENAQLKTGTSPSSMRPIDLVGKTAHYPSDRNPSEFVQLIFQKEHAIFIGLTKVPVLWIVEPGEKPNEFKVRDHRQPETAAWTLIVDPNGESARITKAHDSFSVDARLDYSTPEESAIEPKIRPTP